MKYNIKSFKAEFPNEDACLEYLFKQRYGGKNHTCPKCKKQSGFYRIRTKKVYGCANCGHQLSPTANTIFHKSRTPLTSWYFAIYLMSQSKNGVAAKELERHLGVTYKCAWRMQKQIRSMMSQKTNKLAGTVEVDETYIGGKKRGGKGGRSLESKTPVMGAVSRNSQVRARVVKNAKASTVMPFIRQSVVIGSDIMTDEWASYRGVKKAGYSHEHVNHGRKEYARGDVHTNTIEGFWSQMKRSISGTYHNVSPKHLQSYVDEFAFRYNRRSLNSLLFHHLLRRVVYKPC